ncbi:hypothetical protein DB346_13530 [Verrucomicrobia bacterium LW23]|nr:hypothetical protein DB346_13530 [Verrucomicrobia bacterium LW23]
MEYQKLNFEGDVVIRTPEWILSAPEVEYDPETATLYAPRQGHLLSPAGQEVATGEIRVTLGGEGADAAPTRIRADKLMLPNELRLAGPSGSPDPSAPPGMSMADVLASLSALVAGQGADPLPLVWAGPAEARLPQGAAVEIAPGTLHTALRTLAAQLDLRFRYTEDRVVVEPASNALLEGADALRTSVWQRGLSGKLTMPERVPGYRLQLRPEALAAFGRLVFVRARVSSSMTPSATCEFVEAESMTWTPDPVPKPPDNVPPVQLAQPQEFTVIQVPPSLNPSAPRPTSAVAPSSPAGRPSAQRQREKRVDSAPSKAPKPVAGQASEVDPTAIPVAPPVATEGDAASAPAVPVEPEVFATLESQAPAADAAKEQEPVRSTLLEAEGSVRILDARGQQKLGCAQLIIRLPVAESGRVEPASPPVRLEPAPLPNVSASPSAAEAYTGYVQPGASSIAPSAPLSGTTDVTDAQSLAAASTLEVEPQGPPSAPPISMGAPTPGSILLFRAQDIKMELLTGKPAGSVPRILGVRDVEVRGGGLHLFADYFDIDPVTGQGTARGTVRLMGRDGGVEYSLAPVRFTVDVSSGLGLADVRFNSVTRGDLAWKAGRLDTLAMKAAVTQIGGGTAVPGATNAPSAGGPVGTTLDSEPAPSVQLPDAASHALAAEARRLWDEKRLDEAAARFEEILRKHPTSLLAMGNLGALRLQMGRADEGRALLAKAEELAARDAFAMSSLGLILHRAGCMAEAASALTRAARLEPRDARTRLYLGLALAGSGKLERGIDECRRALELRPQYPEASMQLALLLLRRQPPAMLEARPFYAQAVVLGVPRNQAVEDVLAAPIELLAPFESQHSLALETPADPGVLPDMMASGAPPVTVPTGALAVDTAAPALQTLPGAPTLDANAPALSSPSPAAPGPSPAPAPAPAKVPAVDAPTAAPAPAQVPVAQPVAMAEEAVPDRPASDSLEDLARFVRLQNGLTFENSGMTKVVVTLEEASARVLKESKFDGPMRSVRVIFDRGENDPPAPRVTVTIPPGSTMHEAVRLVGQSIQARVAYGKRAVYFKPRRNPSGGATSGGPRKPAAAPAGEARAE